MTAPAPSNRPDLPGGRPPRDRTAGSAPDRAHIRREALHTAFTLAALTMLLAIAVGVAHIDLGAFSPVIAMTISAAKALLVATIFMRLVREPGVVRLFAAAGLLWLAILFTLALADYQTRPGRAAAPEPTGAGGAVPTEVRPAPAPVPTR